MGANLRQYVSPDDVHVMAARVEAWDNAELDDDGDPIHHEVNEEGDVIIHCKLHRGGTPVKANLGPLCGGRGAGVWIIPDVGTEVVLASDHGDVEGELYLLGMFPTGNVPRGLTKPGQVLIIGMDIQARTRDGAALALPTMADLNAQRQYLATLTLPVSGATAGPPTTPPPTPTGTKIFKAQ